ncbi:MAG TPA: LysR family transcriptional regulator [Granulicella sp.]|jgi:DNA-binding transcriptional LysR family regulator|nr:LysR family transcriptional regulator [Granulicella sp.]
MYDWAEFRHFKYLLTILELQGFRAAAEQLNTGQPNLSIQAKQFQEYASLRLYEKTKDGRIKPTDTGVAFQFIAKSVLEARDEAFEALAAIERGDITSVRFGCSPLVDQALFQSFCQMHRELLPSCTIRPERDDTMQLVEDVLAGVLDAAIVTHPIKHTALRIEEMRRDRLVVCLRKDDPLALKTALQPTDLQEKLTILYHPQRHPGAHVRLMELLADAGVELEGYSRASHPSEMQTLVKDGYGLALIRQGTVLENELTTRPIAGVDWTVDTVVIYHQERHPKTLPVVVRKFKRQLRKGEKQTTGTKPGLAPRPAKDEPAQLTLLS